MQSESNNPPMRADASGYAFKPRHELLLQQLDAFVALHVLLYVTGINNICINKSITETNKSNRHIQYHRCSKH